MMRNNGADVADLVRPVPAGEMDAVKVSKPVNSPESDVPACVAPLAG